MTLEPFLPTAGVLLLLGGCTLATIGLIGLIRRPDLFEQLHVAGLVTGPGVVLVLLASVGTGSANTVTSAILVVAFVLLTSSISTHVIAQAGARRYTSLPHGGNDGSVAAPPHLGRMAGPEAVARPTTTGMRVMVAYDASPAAGLASDLVAAIDWPVGTVVRLVRAERDEIGSSDQSSTRKAEPETSLDRAARLVERPGIRVETAIVRGDVADAIVDDAVAFGADVLVAGSRRGGLVRSMVGRSAAGEILDRAPCPVLVARSASLREVLLAIDGSIESRLAVDLVARWPIFDLARIHVVTVSTRASAAGRGTWAVSLAATEDQRIVDDAAALLMDAGRGVVTEVLHGRPGARIAESAASRSVDLIVIGSRGRTGLGRALLGSVAGEVLASANSSVLVVKRPPRRPSTAASR